MSNGWPWENAMEKREQDSIIQCFCTRMLMYTISLAARQAAARFWMLR